jgi:uncharacterized protein (DUF3084 family)
MTPVIITLIIIGVVCIIVSCFVIDKSSDKNNDNIDLISSSYINSSEVKRKVEDTLLEVSEDTVTKTEDELSKISNEKIIAVNDFSNIVLDKITTNHEEVVFLYNLLNEKEAELKDIINQVNEVKQLNLEKQLNQVEQMNQAKQKEQEKQEKHKKRENKIKQVNQVKYQKDNSLDIDIDIKELEHNIIYDEESMNNNQRILKLYKEGKSVVEIAKELKLGQGEVKLVIDLYR